MRTYNEFEAEMREEAIPERAIYLIIDAIKEIEEHQMRSMVIQFLKERYNYFLANAPAYDVEFPE